MQKFDLITLLLALAVEAVRGFHEIRRSTLRASRQLHLPTKPLFRQRLKALGMWVTGIASGVAASLFLFVHYLLPQMA